MNEIAHSKLGASSMYRWSACPGSVRQCQGKESISSKYAQEGTLAHDIAACVMTKGEWPENVDPEMKNYLTVYIEALIANGFSRHNGNHRIEQNFSLESVYPGCFGTADAVMYSVSEELLSVWDLKYGGGIAVEVENNSQLMYYALGALLEMKVPAKEVEMVIVQPRCPHKNGPVRRWRIPAIDLLEFRADVRSFAKATESPDAPLVPGGHCRFCPAAATCPALHEQSTKLAQQVFSPVVEYNPGDLAVALERAEIMDGWVTAVRSFAYNEAQRGRVIPGWKMVMKRPTRKWKEKANPKTLSEYFERPEKDFLEEPCLKSPAQVEKMLSKADKPKLEHCVVKESSGAKLVRENEPGEPLAVGPSAVFSIQP